MFWFGKNRIGGQKQIKRNVKQWRLDTRNRYYCVKLSCILSRRPFISKSNLTVTYIGDQIEIVEQLVEAM